MSCFQVQDSRFIFKYSTISGETPTIPASDDHTDGTWIPTDIYVGEFFLNVVDNTMFTRTSTGIIPITSGTTTINTTSFVNKSGDTMTGQLNVPILSGGTISGNTIYSNHFEGVFYGDGSNLTGITATIFTGGTVSGPTTFQGDVDMCGIELFVEHINSCGGVIQISGDTNFLGSISATTFYGDGSNLTNLPYFSGNTLDSVLTNGDTSTNGNITLTNGDITLSNGTFIGDGSGLTNLPIGTNPTWEEVLTEGNSSGAYDIFMGGGTYIYSNGGGGYISMDGEMTGDQITIGVNDGSYTSTFNFNSTNIEAGGDVSSFSGITYDQDYSSNYTSRSLVDKGYVDNLVASGATGGTQTLTNVLGYGNQTLGKNIVVTSGDSLNFSGYSMFVTGSPTNPPDTRLVITSLGDNPTNSINLYNGLEGIRMVATDYVGDDVKSDFFLTSYGANFEIQDNDWDGTGKSQRNTTYFQPNNTLFSNQNLTDNLESKFHQILDNQYQTTELLLTDGLKFAKIFATNQNPNGEYTLQHQVDGATTSTLITQTSEVIEVSATSGITYDIDYSANYTNRSLVDKEYVDNLVGANDTLSEVLTNGNNTGSNDIILDDNGSGFTQSIKANNNIFNSQIGYEDIGGTTYAPLMKTEFNFNTNYIRVEDSETRIKNLTLNPAITDGYGEVVVNSNSIQSFVQDNISGDFTSIFSSPSLITVSGNDLIFGGIQYYQDYSTNFTNRSLVDKEYVDNLVGANNTLEEILTNGNSTGANDIIFNEGQYIKHSGSSANNLGISFAADGTFPDIKQIHIKGESNGGYGFVGTENSLGVETKVRLQTRNSDGSGSDIFMTQGDNNITITTNDGSDFSLFDITPGVMTITNPSTTNGTPGLQYDDDYSATFTNRTLVDKEYVDNKTGALVDDNGIQHDEIRASIANGTGIYVDEIGTPNFSKVDVGLSPGGILNQNGINGYTGTSFTNAEIVSRYTEEGTPGTTGYKKLEDNLYLQTKQITYSEDTGYGVDDKLNVNEYVINHFFNDYTGTLDLFYEGFEQEAITDYDVEVYIKNNDTFAPQRQYMVWKMKRTCLYNNSNQSLDISPIDTQKYDYNLNPAYDSWDVTRQTSAFGDFWRLTWNFGNNYDFSVTIKIKQTTKKY